MAQSYGQRLASFASRIGKDVADLSREERRAARGHALTPERPAGAERFYQRQGITRDQVQRIFQERKAEKRQASEARKSEHRQEVQHRKEERHAKAIENLDAKYHVVTSPFLLNNQSKFQYGVAGPGMDIKAGPTPQQAERGAPPSPAQALQALSHTRNEEVVLAVLLRIDGETRWLATLARRDELIAELERIRPGWSRLSYADRQAVMMDVIVRQYMGEVLEKEETSYGNEVDRVLGFSFADAWEKQEDDAA